MVSPTNFIANYYRVCHVDSAIIPSSRLSKILASMHQGQPLTRMSLDFLKQEGFYDLFRLASGEITREAYLAALGQVNLMKNHDAELAIKAKEDIVNRELHRVGNLNFQRRDHKSERDLHRKRERDADEIATKERLARQAQRDHNNKLAAAVYQSYTINTGRTDPTPCELASYFHLAHVADNLTAPMIAILRIVFRGIPLISDQRTYLRLHGPSALYRYEFGQLTLETYSAEAKIAEIAGVAQKARDDAEKAARIARESTPEYIAMIQAQTLHRKYEVLLIDKSLKSRMTTILQQLDTGNRLAKEDLEWLGTHAKKHFTKPLRKKYHRLEADFHANQYRRNKDSWNAINACGHYRKCGLPDTALELIDSIALDSIKQLKVKSAVLTTRGGVMRDLNRRPEAIQMGETAHALMPQDYRPCTLLGAVHMELRSFENGHAWYEKARTLGAPEHGIDSDIRSIYRQLDSSGQENMKRALLAEDPYRYSWLNDAKSKSKHSIKSNI